MQFPAETDKETVFSEVEAFIEREGFTISDRDDSRPWGGFFVIEEREAPAFISRFFPEVNPADFTLYSKLSPKILLVAPGKRLSWQYHHRRAEIWRVTGGRAGVVISDTDEETEPRHLETGSLVELKQGQRHRLLGLDEWGVVAEIWKHTDPDAPSDEEDIVRVQDDFGR